MAEFRALRSDFARMLHLRARTFAPLTIRSDKCLAFIDNLGQAKPKMAVVKT